MTRKVGGWVPEKCIFQYLLRDYFQIIIFLHKFIQMGRKDCFSPQILLVKNGYQSNWEHLLWFHPRARAWYHVNFCLHLASSWHVDSAQAAQFPNPSRLGGVREYMCADNGHSKVIAMLLQYILWVIGQHLKYEVHQ